VLAVAVLTITLLSILIAKKTNRQLTTLQLTLDEYSVCTFDYSHENTEGSTFDKVTVDKKEQFQLLASSRYSFFGCWLHMSALSNQHKSNRYLSKPLLNAINKKRLFIYRDSLSTEDFSRLSQVIRKLKNTA